MNARHFPLIAGIVALVLVLAVIVVSLTSSTPTRQQVRTQEAAPPSSFQEAAPQQPTGAVEQNVTLPPTVETTVDIE
ncbi:MAG: hypothetical protein AAB855_01235 [Patescibacteria group bacterium]